MSCLHEKYDDYNTGTEVCIKCGLVFENNLLVSTNNFCPEKALMFNKELEETQYRWINDINIFADFLNIKQDSIELARSIYKDYLKFKKERKILPIICLFYSSKILNYTLDRKNFLNVYENYYSDVFSEKKFRNYSNKLNNYIKTEYESFGKHSNLINQTQDQLYYYENYYSFFLYYKSLESCKLTNLDYKKIIDDLYLKLKDVCLINKSLDGVFLVCFMTFTESFNREKEFCKYFNLNASCLKTIKNIYNKI